MGSFLYVISASELGPVKIGLSIHPEKRVRQLQTGHAEKLALHHREPITEQCARPMEQIVHRENRHRKLKGEWFDMTVAEAVAEIRHAMIRFESEAQIQASFRTN